MAHWLRQSESYALMVLWVPTIAQSNAQRKPRAYAWSYIWRFGSSCISRTTWWGEDRTVNSQTCASSSALSVGTDSLHDNAQVLLMTGTLLWSLITKFKTMRSTVHKYCGARDYLLRHRVCSPLTWVVTADAPSWLCRQGFENRLLSKRDGMKYLMKLILPQRNPFQQILCSSRTLWYLSCTSIQCLVVLYQYYRTIGQLLQKKERFVSLADNLLHYHTAGCWLPWKSHFVSLGLYTWRSRSFEHNAFLNLHPRLRYKIEEPSKNFPHHRNVCVKGCYLRHRPSQS